MAQVVTPASESQLVDIVRAALADAATLEICGHGTRGHIGHPGAGERRVDLSALTGVTVYEPSELVMTAMAATPLVEIEKALAAEGQYLAFEAPDFGPLWGAPEGLGSLGGMMAVGMGGSRRPKAGAPRDHLLGFRAVNGFGDAFAGGGRVVKNVTGFDLPKLMAGSMGTLGAMTELTLKVLPRPDLSCTLAIGGFDEADGLSVLRQATAGTAPVTGAAYLPEGMGAKLPHPSLPGEPVALIRLEGVTPAVRAAIDRFSAAYPARATLIEGEASARLWSAIGGGWAFAGVDTTVVRISLPPARGAAVGAALRGLGVTAFHYDWAGGLILAETSPTPGGDVDAIRAAVQAVAGEGHVTVIRRGADLSVDVPSFHPPAPGVAALSERVRRQFDPAGLFNPGRMFGGA